MSAGDRDRFDLEGELRAARPRASRRFLAALAASAGPVRAGFRGRRPLTVALVGVASLVVAGGIGFAASSAIESGQVSVKRVAADGAREIAVRNAARAVYVDEGPVETKPGAPQVTVTQRKDESGDPVPIVATTSKNDPDVTLTASMTVNESGTLSIQVLDADGIAVPIDCSRTILRGGEVGTGEAKICRTVVNTPGTITVSIKVPARTLEAGENLTIRLGFTDRDKSPTRTVVNVPAAAPKVMPTVERSFQLSAEELKDARDATRCGNTEVRFRAFVSPKDIDVTIIWPGQQKTNGRTVGPVSYDRDDRVDRTALVRVIGGDIGAGEFSITVKKDPPLKKGQRPPKCKK
jgi:hypothetical protein